MSGALLAVLVVAALACPAHMLWMRLRHGKASCLMTVDRCAGESVEQRQRRLAEQIEALAATRAGGAASEPGGTTVCS